MGPRSLFKRVLLITTVSLAAIISVNATEGMQRPDRYKEAPSRVSTDNNPKTHVITRRQISGKASFAYFTNWGIYGANFQPTDVVSAPLTHVLYAFADIDQQNGTILLTDSFSDEEKRFTGDVDEPGSNLYGCLKQLYLLKLKQRNLKLLLSIGGWTYSQAGHFDFVTSASARANFVSSAVKVVEDYGFDGVDIDFEYPANLDQGQGLADLMTALRIDFDDLAAKKGDESPYLITSAVAAGPLNYAHLKIPQMNAAMNFWNLMAYDYAGPWSTVADNMANLFGGERSGFNTDNAVKFYLGAGASTNKLVVGMPLYGRIFENTTGLGRPYDGIGEGTLEAGVYSYKFLPLEGAQVFVNTTDVSSYSYDPVKKEFVTYETPDIVRLKVDYIKSMGLAGSMFWELSTDKVGDESLVGTAAKSLGYLDQTPNHINYPNSKWDNLRRNFAPPPEAPPATESPTPVAESLH